MIEAVRCRPVREEEIPETADVFLTALADMYRRNGVLQPLTPRPVVEINYRHIYRTGIFQVAELEGRIVGICHAIVREQLWFLSGFWVLPEAQQHGVGGALFKRVREEGESQGATIFFTWSSIDQGAMGGYMKRGMLPGYQILTFGGPVVSLPEQAESYQVEPLDLSEAMRLDEQVRGVRREVDHRFWLDESGHQGHQLVRSGRVVGYYYFVSDVVGPAAWGEDADAEALICAASRMASSKTGHLRLMIPGINHKALRFALRAGLRLVGYSHFLTTHEFGRLEQYMPSGPALF